MELVNPVTIKNGDKTVVSYDVGNTVSAIFIVNLNKKIIGQYYQNCLWYSYSTRILVTRGFNFNIVGVPDHS